KGGGLPLEPEHQAVQPAADAEEADAVAGLEELAFLGESGSQRQRDGADVAEVLVGAEVLLRRDPEGLQHRLTMPGADLVTDHLVQGLASPAELAEERLPGAVPEFHAVLQHLAGVSLHEGDHGVLEAEVNAPDRE